MHPLVLGVHTPTQSPPEHRYGQDVEVTVSRSGPQVYLVWPVQNDSFD